MSSSLGTVLLKNSVPQIIMINRHKFGEFLKLNMQHRRCSECSFENPVRWNPAFMFTQLIQLSCHYSHFILTGTKAQSVCLFSYLKNTFNMTTPLIWPDFCGPLMTGLTSFNSETEPCYLNLRYLKLLTFSTKIIFPLENTFC